MGEGHEHPRCWPSVSSSSQLELKAGQRHGCYHVTATSGEDVAVTKEYRCADLGSATV